MYGQSNMDIALNSEKWNSSKWGNDQTPNNLQLMVTNYGGKSRRRSRRCHCKHKHCKHKRSRGGTYSISSNGVADNAEKWNPKWGKDQTPSNLQQMVTNYGGKSRKHRRHNKRRTRGGYSSPYSSNLVNMGEVNSSGTSSNTSSNTSSTPESHTQNSSFSNSASSKHT